MTCTLACLQIRASDDYVPGSTEGLGQWHLGSSSILAHALDLAPFKVGELLTGIEATPASQLPINYACMQDNFWTTNDEGPTSSLPNKTDPAGMSVRCRTCMHALLYAPLDAPPSPCSPTRGSCGHFDHWTSHPRRWHCLPEQGDTLVAPPFARKQICGWRTEHCLEGKVNSLVFLGADYAQLPQRWSPDSP